MSSDLSKQQPFRTSSMSWTEKGAARTVAMAFGLGILFGLGIGLILFSESVVGYGFYLLGLALFHMWEYIWVAMYDPELLSTKSFLINHSPSFNIALLVGFLEYWFEWYFFPSLKSYGFFAKIGTLVMFLGQIIRTVAMITAGNNFSHIIADTKKSTHKLVTTGIYSYVRHPSYFGWFFWSVATQFVLGNPICTIGYTLASWFFFFDRIDYEEETLIEFFGNEYKEYRKKVWSGIPLIK